MAVFLERTPDGVTARSDRGLTVFCSPDQSWDLVISGPGVFNTARALTACLERCQPEFVLHTGIAGIFDSFSLHPGDAAVALSDTYIHTGVDCTYTEGDRYRALTRQSADKDPVIIQKGLDHAAFKKNKDHWGRADHLFGQTPLPGGCCFQMPLEPLPFDLVAGQAMTRQGVYMLDPDLAGSCRNLLAGSLGCRVAQGPFVTVSSITGSFTKAAVLSQAFSPVMESMEGAAAAHVAALYQVPMVEIRAASNRVGERDKARWDIQRAVLTVADICETILGEST